MTENENDEQFERSPKDKLAGLGQKLIGEIEEIGGALTGDPITQAEGQLNVDVGEMREGSYEDAGDDSDNEKQRV